QPGEVRPRLRQRLGKGDERRPVRPQGAGTAAQAANGELTGQRLPGKASGFSGSLLHVLGSLKLSSRKLENCLHRPAEHQELKTKIYWKISTIWDYNNIKIFVESIILKGCLL